MGVFNVNGFGVDESGNAVATGSVTAASVAATTVTGTTATVSGLLTQSAQTVAMAGNNKTLIMSGTPTANQVLVTSNVLALSATGATRTLTLPAASAATGIQLTLLNAGAIDIDVTDGSTVTTVAGGKGLLVVSNGSGFGRLTGA